MSLNGPSSNKNDKKRSYETQNEGEPLSTKKIKRTKSTKM